MMTPLHQRFWDENLARLPAIWQAGLRHPRVRFVWELVGAHRRYHGTLPSSLGLSGVTSHNSLTNEILFATSTFDDDTFLHEATHALVALVKAWDERKVPTEDANVVEVYCQALETKQSLDAFMEMEAYAYSLKSPDEFLADLVGLTLTDEEFEISDDGEIHPFIHPLGEDLWPGSTQKLLAAERQFTAAIAAATAALGPPDLSKAYKLSVPEVDTTAKAPEQNDAEASEAVESPVVPVEAAEAVAAVAVPVAAPIAPTAPAQPNRAKSPQKKRKKPARAAKSGTAAADITDGESMDEADLTIADRIDHIKAAILADTIEAEPATKNPFFMGESADNGNPYEGIVQL